MTARGSAWDGRPFDPPTAPLPRVDYVGDDGPGYVAPVGLPPRRRGRRWLRRALATIVVLVVVLALALGALLAITLSVSNAQALAQAQDANHHAVYPGPPVPARFSDSLVATEDHRFYSEPGIDILALARVVEAGVTGQGDQGGATLYQQLAKLLYTNGTSGIKAKVEQVGLAEKLYLTYSHAQILQMYADVAYF